MKRSILAILALACLSLGVPQATPAADAATQVRTTTAKLLKEIDKFKNNPMFKQCLYGCGDSNPGAAWNEKRQQLADFISEHDSEIPANMRSIPGALFTLGKAYAKDNKNDIKYFRSEVESAIKK